jgi:O-antigen/teichoic acid export membrane protein
MKLGDGLLRGASASLMIRISGMALSWFSVVTLTRLLGVDGYGAYAFLLSAVMLLSLPATFGTPTLLVREVSAAQATRNWVRMRGAALWSVRFSLVMSLPIAAAAIIVLLFFPQLVPANLRAGLMWAAILIVLSPLTAIRGGILRGLHQVALGQAPEQIVRPLALIALLFLPMLWGHQIRDPGGAMAANVGAMVIAWLAGMAALAYFWPKEANSAKPEYEPQRWRASLIPLGLTNAMIVIDGEVGVLLLGLIASHTETGIFKGAVQFALLSSLGYTVVNVNVTPRIAAALSRQGAAGTPGDEVQRIVTRGSRLSVALCLPVVLVLIFFGPWAIPFILGSDFGDAWIPVVILCIGQLINAAFGSAPSVLNMSHNERSNLIGFCAGLVINIVLTLILTPSFGATGAATATMVSVVLRNLILWRYAWVKLGIETGFWGRRA